MDWVEALQYCKFDDAARYVVSALQNGWNLPPGLQSAHEANKRKEEQRAAEECQARTRRQAEEDVRRRKEGQEEAWDALPEDARQMIIAAATDAIASKPMGQRILEGPIGEFTLRSRCLEIAVGVSAEIRNKASPPQKVGGAENVANGDSRDNERLSCQEVNDH